jgi:CRP/FNR family transcriptional regulator, cyclic AMP receptor protein
MPPFAGRGSSQSVRLGQICQGCLFPISAVQSDLGRGDVGAADSTRRCYESRVPGAPIDVLRRVPLFAELDADELQTIAGAMHEHTFAAGETVTVEGTPGDAFFVVESGDVEILREGERRATLGPGDYFGEIALLMGTERTATVRATSDLRCYSLTPLDFRNVVEGNPAIAWDVMQTMTSRLP